jgi:predicted short-subunit dehydrogenase-like oxidoreductase (DUF2520 family)
MTKPHSVSFIGSGNLAWHLATALDNTEFAVREVYSRKYKNAKALVERLYQADVMESLDFSASTSSIFVIAIPDDDIETVAQEIILPYNAILVHTSGSQPLSVLSNAKTTNTGVFYPLQTFSKGQKVDFKDVPIFIESDDSAVEKVLMSMAKSISKRVQKISSEDRKALHVAAVFAANFTNHMLTLSKEIMVRHKLNFDLLKPLIAETLNKSLTIGPENSQTGPAKRGDLEILDKHVEFLSNTDHNDDETVAEIYKLVSQHIIDHYNR